MIKINILRRENKILEEVDKALFRRWFTDFEFPNEENKPYKSSGGEMRDSEVGSIPKGWQVSEIGKEITIHGGSTPSTSERE